MKIFKHEIAIYGFELTIILFNETKVSSPHIHEYAEFMATVSSKEEVTNELIGKAMDGAHNGGDTLYNNLSNKFVVVFYPHTSYNQLLNSIGHEKRHVEDHIIRDCDIDGMEAAGYLSGYLTQFFMNQDIINFYNLTK